MYGISHKRRTKSPLLASTILCEPDWRDATFPNWPSPEVAESRQQKSSNGSGCQGRLFESTAMTLGLPDSARSPRYSLNACLEQTKRPPNIQSNAAHPGHRLRAVLHPLPPSKFNASERRRRESKDKNEAPPFQDRESATIVLVSAVACPPCLRCCGSIQTTVICGL